MNDMELAEEIEHNGLLFVLNRVPIMELGGVSKQIIAALRRGREITGTYACPYCARDCPHDSTTHAADYRESRNALAEWVNRYHRVASVSDAQKLIEYVLAWHRGEDMKDVIGAQIPRLRVTPERPPSGEMVPVPSVVYDALKVWTGAEPSQSVLARVVDKWLSAAEAEGRKG